jgi:hypothetical protein
MGHLGTIGLRHKAGLVAAATALCVCSVLSLIRTSAEAAEKAVALIPLTLKGPGSLTGVWNGAASSADVTTADGKPIPYQPAVAKLLEQQKDKGKAIDMQSAPWCVPIGMPAMMDPPPSLPLQILETPRQVTMLFGDFGTFRIIHLNEKHPDDPDPTYFGNSVGHWEGDTLVVDTIALLDKTTLFGAPHTEDMHLVERFHRSGEGILEDRITIEDSKTYSKPWTWVITLKSMPGAKVKEFERRPC